ncbi:hypothetical protein [Atopobacter phocae]|uniref:hypothetical protein n=1 Tax=Atopobacter phocae TaxID=136492 RepID=UPI00046F041A|nr:hypothetical protein [Atopobacter phocae]
MKIQIAQAYGIVLDDIDEYDFGFQTTNEDSSSYDYMLVQMSDDEFPQLLVAKEEKTNKQQIKIFTFNPHTLKVKECSEQLSIGQLNKKKQADILIEKNQIGLNYTVLNHNTAKIKVEKITIENNNLVKKVSHNGQLNEMKNSKENEPISWQSIDDRTILNAFGQEEDYYEVANEHSKQSDNEVEQSDDLQEKKEDKSNDKKQRLDELIESEKQKGGIVVSGTLKYLNHFEVLKIQGAPDPNNEPLQQQMNHLILILDEPTEVTARRAGGPGLGTHEAQLITLGLENVLPEYNNQKIILVFSPEDATWPSDTSVPLGEPRVLKFKILNE